MCVCVFQGDQVPGIFRAGPEKLLLAQIPEILFHSPDILKNLAIVHKFIVILHKFPPIFEKRVIFH